MFKRVDKLGRRYGRLLVIDTTDVKDIGGSYFFLCRCDCGNIVKKSSRVLSDVERQSTKSCGCLRHDVSRKHLLGNTFFKKHGASNTQIYYVWKSMKDRCFRQKCKDYPYYGGRGITVCDRWLKFENFLADMGERPDGTSIDRIDNDGNYEPSNCRWATWSEQMKNKRYLTDTK
jgi:hypothetical protein